MPYSFVVSPKICYSDSRQTVPYHSFSPYWSILCQHKIALLRTSNGLRSMRGTLRSEHASSNLAAGRCLYNIIAFWQSTRPYARRQACSMSAIWASLRLRETMHRPFYNILFPMMLHGWSFARRFTLSFVSPMAM